MKMLLFISLAILPGCLGQLTFPESYVIIPNSGLTLYFEFNETNSSVLLGLDLAEDANYFSVGFADRGNWGMADFDCVAVVFVANDNSGENFTPVIYDLWSYFDGHPPPDTQLNGTSDYYLVDAYATKGRRQALFVRAIDTKDKYDYVLDPEKTRYKVVMNWAWMNNGKPKVNYHAEHADTVIAPLVNGYQGTAEIYTPGGFWTPDKILAIHGYIMLFGWGFLIDVALQLVRYGKANKFYMIIHACLVTLLYTTTGLTSGIVLWMNWGSIYGRYQRVHYYFGIFIFALMSVQMIFGLLLGIKIIREKFTKAIPSLSRFHAVGGILQYVLNKLEVALGFYLYKRNWVNYLMAYYLASFSYRIFQEYRYRKKDFIISGSHKMARIEDSLDEKHRKLMTLLNSNTPINQILKTPELKDLKWAVFEDKVFTMKDFDHPGGNFILNHVNGHEISRYIYGAFGLFYPQKYTQHAHSRQTLQIIEKNVIGIIQNGYHVLFAKDDNNYAPSASLLKEQNLNMTEDEVSSKSRLLIPSVLNIGNPNANWMLADKKQITPNISQFEFKCKDYYIASAISDIRHIGKHMRISHASLPKNRLYTLVLSQTDFRTKRRDLLWKRYMKEDSSLVDFSSTYRSETLPLIIKNYDFPGARTFSSLAHRSALGTEGFTIEGPFGHGFGLTLKSTGVHTVFAAGTGILPFLDLFDYLLESVLEESNLVTNVFREGFSLHVYASFASISDFVGLDICEKLAEVCARGGLPVGAFRLVVKAPDAKESEFFKVTQGEFNAAFIDRHFDESSQKAYICGPPMFNDIIPKDLKNIGFPAERIIIV